MTTFEKIRDSLERAFFLGAVHWEHTRDGGPAWVRYEGGERQFDRQLMLDTLKKMKKMVKDNYGENLP